MAQAQKHAMPDERAPRVGERAFKLAMRAFAGAVTIIAAQDESGDSFGLTATSACSLSMDPPSLLVCINRKSGLTGALKPGAIFSLNLPNAQQSDIAEAFGGMRGVRGRGKFTYGAWHRGESGAPLLGGARVGFECRVAEALPRATHLIVIGEVIDVHIAAGISGALAYHNGHFTEIA